MMHHHTTISKESRSSGRNGTHGGSVRMARNVAEKQRRDRLNSFINDLANSVPLVARANKRLDKTSILRLTAAYLRLHDSPLSTASYRRSVAAKQVNGHIPGRREALDVSLILTPDQLDSLMDGLDGFLIVVNADFKLIFVSATCERFLGHQNIDLMGFPLTSFIHPSDAESVKTALSDLKHEFLSSGKSESRRMEVRCRVRERSQPRTELVTYQLVQISGFFQLACCRPANQFSCCSFSCHDSAQETDEVPEEDIGLGGMSADLEPPSQQDVLDTSDLLMLGDGDTSDFFHYSQPIMQDMDLLFNLADLATTDSMSSDHFNSLSSSMSTISSPSFTTPDLQSLLSPSLMPSPSSSLSVPSDDQSILDFVNDSSSSFSATSSAPFPPVVGSTVHESSSMPPPPPPPVSMCLDGGQKSQQRRQKCRHADARGEDHDHSPKSLSKNLLFKGFVKVLPPSPMSELSLVDANQEEYVSRISLDGTLLYADHRITLVLGYTPAEVIGKSAYKFILVPDHVISLFAHKLMLSSSNGTGIVVHRLRTRSGGFIYLQSAGCLQYDRTTGKVDHFVCVGRMLPETQGFLEMQKFINKFSPHVSSLTPSSLYKSLQMAIAPTQQASSCQSVVSDPGNYVPHPGPSGCSAGSDFSPDPASFTPVYGADYHVGCDNGNHNSWTYDPDPMSGSSGGPKIQQLS